MIVSHTESTPTINITLLGKFTLSYGELQITESSSRTRKLWNLLAFLVVNRKKLLSQEIIIRAMWPDESCENPSNALKNLVYRIRNTLSDYGFPFAKDLIVFQNGSYCWNNKIPCSVDIELFDSLCRQASSEKFSEKFSLEQRISFSYEALALYEGDFLPSFSCEEWVVSGVSLYRSSYLYCVYNLVDLLHEKNDLDKIKQICENALLIDPYDEKTNMLLIQCLSEKGNQKQALQQYYHTSDVFFKELGVNPSVEMRNLYREIAKSVHDVEVDLTIIKNDLSESADVKGAFYCEYEIFKDMYRVQARTVARTKQKIFLGLLTLLSPDGSIPQTNILNLAMSTLENCIRKYLRCGDVFSRYSTSQFVIMFPTSTYEGGQVVLNRVVNYYKRQSSQGALTILSNLQPLDPIQSKNIHHKM